MSNKGNCRPSGRYLRRSGYPVNGIVSCGYVREVFDLLSQPRTIDEIARITESSPDRVRLALSDLKASGVIIS